MFKQGELRTVKIFFMFAVVFMVLFLEIIVVTTSTDIISEDDSLGALSLSPSIIDLYSDAKYAWDKLVDRRDLEGAIFTSLYEVTGVKDSRYEKYGLAHSLNLLPTFYSMYKLTNDSYYLDRGWEMFNDILRYCKKTINKDSFTATVILRYNLSADQVINDYLRPTSVYVPISIEDSRYLKSFEELVSSTYKLFVSKRGLIYRQLLPNGSVYSSDQHLTWGTAANQKISQLIWLSWVTKNDTYRQWANNLIEAIWSLRNNETNLLPRRVSAKNGYVLDRTISHYDMAGWLSVLEEAYYLSGKNRSAGTPNYSYYELIESVAKAIAKYFWHSDEKRWVYRCFYDTGLHSNSIPEMNSIYVDSVMLHAYEITKNESFKEKAITDFNTAFMGEDPTYPNGVLTNNSLIIHSPATYSTQSQLSGGSNFLVGKTAYHIFSITRNQSYLQKSSFHYHRLMKGHRFAKGYASIINSATLNHYGKYLGHEITIYDLAPIIPLMNLPTAIITSKDVKIDYGFGSITTTIPSTYGKVDPIMGITVDIKNNVIRLDNVTSTSLNGQIMINYGMNYHIKKLLIDGHPVEDFSLLTINCQPGDHSYTIYFKKETIDFSDLNTIMTLLVFTFFVMLRKVRRRIK